MNGAPDKWSPLFYIRLENKNIDRLRPPRVKRGTRVAFVVAV